MQTCFFGACAPAACRWLGLGIAQPARGQGAWLTGGARGRRGLRCAPTGTGQVNSTNPSMG